MLEDGICEVGDLSWHTREIEDRHRPRSPEPVGQHADERIAPYRVARTRLEEETFPQTVRQEMRKVRVRRLDDVLAELGRKPDARTLLKLDIQGFEEQALRGSAQTLATCGAFETEVSLAALYVGQPDFYTLYTIARDAGLTYAGNHYQHIGKDGRVVFLDALFVR